MTDEDADKEEENGNDVSLFGYQEEPLIRQWQLYYVTHMIAHMIAHMVRNTG
jgi:hypothetical protein